MHHNNDSQIQTLRIIEVWKYRTLKLKQRNFNESASWYDDHGMVTIKLKPAMCFVAAFVFNALYAQWIVSYRRLKFGGCWSHICKKLAQD